MNAKEYKNDPCRASSLPFYKAEGYVFPSGIRVFRDDQFSGLQQGTKDEPYFKLIHHLDLISSTRLAEKYELSTASACEFSAHIEECYDWERASERELESYKAKPVYSSNLWIVIRDRVTGEIVASGIGEFDPRIREGILDWIQVSPDYRGKGLGKIIVCELLHRMQGRADFVTVSGRVNNLTNPMALYMACGFTNPVIWHIVDESE